LYKRALARAKAQHWTRVAAPDWARRLLGNDGMASNPFHEAAEQLRPETRDLHRAIRSLM
jgi:hypothetical protein